MTSSRTVRNVAARYKAAMEHSSPEALKEYLKEHPGADKSKHKVKKPEDGDKADISDIKTKMTFGVMPSKKDFETYVHNAINPDTDEPYWPEGKPYRMHLRGEDATVQENADLPDTFDTPEEAYAGLEKLMAYADREEDEDLREAAESLASSIMTTLGFEWI